MAPNNTTNGFYGIWYGIYLASWDRATAAYSTLDPSNANDAASDAWLTLGQVSYSQQAGIGPPAFSYITKIVDQSNIDVRAKRIVTGDHAIYMAVTNSTNSVGVVTYSMNVRVLISRVV